MLGSCLIKRLEKNKQIQLKNKKEQMQKEERTVKTGYITTKVMAFQ